jgi:hypothetical protein
MQSLRLYLDTSKRDKSKSTATQFVWNVNLLGQFLDGVTVLNSSDIQNVRGIKTIDMLIYNENSRFIFSPNIMMQIKEFATDAFQSGNLRYHFSFNTDNSLLCRVKNKGEYEFNQRFTVMPSTLTVTFYNEWAPAIFPIFCPLYMDVNTDTIDARAQLANGTITQITAIDPLAAGSPPGGYSWATFYKTTDHINSICNGGILIVVNLTTDNPADAALLGTINTLVYRADSITHLGGMATIYSSQLATDTHALAGNITQPITLHAICTYQWANIFTSRFDLIINNPRSLMYIKNFTANLEFYKNILFNNLVNRQDGWPIIELGAVVSNNVIIIIGLNPLQTAYSLSISAVGCLDSLKLIIPLEIKF